MTDVFKLIEANGLTLHGDIEHFAELVRADEREACQDVCDDVYRAWTLRDDEDETDPPDPIDCKLAIRARGNT